MEQGWEEKEEKGDKWRRRQRHGNEAAENNSRDITKDTFIKQRKVRKALIIYFVKNILDTVIHLMQSS